MIKLFPIFGLIPALGLVAGGTANSASTLNQQAHFTNCFQYNIQKNPNLKTQLESFERCVVGRTNTPPMCAQQVITKTNNSEVKETLSNFLKECEQQAGINS